MSRRLREYRFLTVAVLLGALGTALAKAQDGDVGVAMPFNVSAGLLNTQRLQSDDPSSRWTSDPARSASRMRPPGSAERRE